MACFYQNSSLQLGNSKNSIDLRNFCANHDTPFYIYDIDDVLHRLALLQEAFKQNICIHYAMKANSNRKLLKILATKGIGIDVVSEGEMRIALACGFSAKDIIFAGVGKTVAELEFAISHQIKQINVESPQELIRIGEIAAHKQQRVAIAFRINPDVDPQTHPYITTGFRENKFGMDKSFLPELMQILQKYKNEISLQGCSIHIGSQISNINSFVEAIEKTIPIYQELKALGHPLKNFDIGGGLGIHYQREIEAENLETISNYGKAITKALSPIDCQIFCEPGRTLVGPAGLLISEVQYIKETPYKNFAITNTGMHHILRPSLYQAEHRIVPLVQKPQMIEKTYDVVGPICESADVLGYERKLPTLNQGDHLALCDAGAYGYSMASFYNAHKFPQEYLFYQGEILQD